MYKEVGEVMSRYRTGKIPKAFKIIPSMVNWEQILEYVVGHTPVVRHRFKTDDAGEMDCRCDAACDQTVLVQPQRKDVSTVSGNPTFCDECYVQTQVLQSGTAAACSR